MKTNAECIVHNSESRSGISLMEVLISIGIMAIGMLSIASLLPVGNIQTQRANVEERKAELGLNAYREFQIRGMGKASALAGTTVPASVSSAQQIADASKDCEWITADGQPFIRPVSGTWTASAKAPLVIDPVMVAAGQTAVDLFPVNGISGGPTLKRLSLRQAAKWNGSLFVPDRALSEAACMLSDELVVDQPDDRTLPATGRLDSSNSKRDFEGNYTWLAMLAPQAGDTADATAMKQCVLSIVIFDRRRASTPSPGSGQEEQVSVNAPPSGTTVNLGGGEMTLTVSATTDIAKFDLAKPGNWLMLCRTYDVTPAVTPKPRIAKWYRIISASEGSTSTSLDVTLAGPDWVWGDTSNLTYACLFDGAVAVYERSIHLEDPSSIWNQ